MGLYACFSEARERRKEVRAQLDRAQEYLLSIESASRAFHTAESYGETKAMDLQACIDVFERKLRRITCVEVDCMTEQIVSFRRAITLNNFGKSEFNTQGAQSEILGAISDAVFGIEDALESQYAARYPNKFPYFRIWKFSRDIPNKTAP